MTATTASAVVRVHVLANTYRDSVELMRMAAELERLPDIQRAAVTMATPANRAILLEAGFVLDTVSEPGPNDLVIAVSAATVEACEAAVARAQTVLAAREAAPMAPAGHSALPAPRTIAEAVAEQPTAKLVIISTPGAFATAEALKALKHGLHVMLFSDNVPLADEIELKRLGARKGLLVMGPDCGTAILDGIPLGFANVVRRGPVGLV
ncbi:MAG TPA: transcriptional regulator, partial [Chloroflexota bacterium]|nr:transcriptional regulator [Chloroflexota bacterium]